MVYHGLNARRHDVTSQCKTNRSNPLAFMGYSYPRFPKSVVTEPSTLRSKAVPSAQMSRNSHRNRNNEYPQRLIRPIRHGTRRCDRQKRTHNTRDNQAIAGTHAQWSAMVAQVRNLPARGGVGGVLLRRPTSKYTSPPRPGPKCFGTPAEPPLRFC